MMYLIPTKKGRGVEIWGSWDDLDIFHQVIGKHWNNPDQAQDQKYENRNHLISGFSYEIRKAKEGSRLIWESSHFNRDTGKHFGTKISWIQFLFAIAALKQNMQETKVEKIDKSMFLLIEYWLERAMFEYDPKGAKTLVKYIEGTLFGDNQCIYQFMRSINMEYFKQRASKTLFRRLPDMLKRGVYGTDDFFEFEAYLDKSAQKIGCEKHELEFDDKHVDYEHKEW